jgi:threonine dehydrogenase-like Zn-dependent dehydrogenase
VRAAVYDGIGSIELGEVDPPRIGETELLVKVGAASICATDLRILASGHHQIPEGQRRVLGHEFAGEIVEVGACVEGFRPGMRVAVAPNVGCGTCRYCRKGYTHLCARNEPFGIGRDGGFAEYVRIHGKAVEQGNLIPLNGETSFEEAALAEPLACCHNALRSVATRPGESVLIVGAGPMGILHLQLQKLAGASPLMVSDLAENRLRMAGRFGPDVLINPEKQDVAGVVMMHTGGEGVDVVITAVPSPRMQQQAVHLAANLGRINLFGGLPKGTSEVPLATNIIHYKGIVVTGTTGESLSDYETAVRLIVQRKIDVGSLISRKFPIERVKEAFAYAGSGEGLKTLLTFD